MNVVNVVLDNEFYEVMRRLVDISIDKSLHFTDIGVCVLRCYNTTLLLHMVQGMFVLMCNM